jgi:hypothetical protein
LFPLWTSHRVAPVKTDLKAIVVLEPPRFSDPILFPGPRAAFCKNSGNRR